MKIIKEVIRDIEHISKCPRSGEINLMYVIKRNYRYGILRERFRGYYLGSIPKLRWKVWAI